MKFLVDAQLPLRIARFLQLSSYDTLHTKDLKLGNSTPDSAINDIAVAKGVRTKFWSGCGAHARS